MKFPSNKDLLFTIIVWGSMLFSLGSGLYFLYLGKINFGVFVSLVIPIFILWIWLTTYYVLDDSNLVIRYGPFKKIIPLNLIKSVKKTINPLASPALSLKRLEITYGQYNNVLISPKNREEFMKILKERCPQAEIKIE